MWWATIRLGVRNLLLHKLRSFLTVLGTILGVASVIAMLSVGEGSKQAAVEQIRQLGATNVMVRSVRPGTRAGSENQSAAAASSGSSTNPSRVLRYGLKEDDLRVLQGLVDTTELGEPLVRCIVPVSLLRKNLQNGRRRIENARVLGTTPQFLQVRNIQVARGRFLEESDLVRLANVVVLSHGAARRLFGYEDPLNQPLLIGEGAYRVVGILAPQGTGNATPGQTDAANLNEDLYIPITSARSRFGQLQRIVTAGSRSYEINELSEIAIAVRDEDRVPQVAEMVRSLLEARHPDATDYEVVVPLELLQQAEHEKRIWNIVLGSIAGISLLVGGIGIMNIMLATVTERTREIGIRRAIGAKRRDIIRQFLVETVALSTTGGLIGILLGIAIPWLVTTTMGIPTATQWWSILLAFGISVLTGVVFGVYPARKAAHMNPIEALRHQ
ncbi:MAG: ABC transporter substrate-binding protein [Pirellulaceae bacterium]|nr:MAG: ABC transporter substrate-binding protein [Pirellulaceae bacterium]